MCRFDQSIFENPPREYAVAYAWCWNTPITKELIKKTLSDMKRGGIGATYVIPEPKEFRPNTMNNNMTPAYLSEEYFELFKYFTDTAKELGMTVWLYDEAGWPSGGAGSQISKMRPDLARHNIQCIEIPLSKGMIYTPPTHQSSFLAAYKKDRNNNFTRIRDTLIHDGQSTIIEYRCLRVNFRVDCDVENDTDLLNPETTKLFLQMTHERYKKALGDDWGTYIKYIFDDEAATEPYVWTNGLEKQFYEEYGYDILDYLPVIREQIPAETEQQRKARSDWRRLVSKLLNQNFFKPIQHWCHENGIRSIGHVDNDHSADSFITWLPCNAMPLETLRCFDVPGVDVIYRHIYPEGLSQYVPQQTVPFFPRFAASAAAQTGTGLALTESMACYGAGATQSIMRYVFGAQAVRGINVFNCNSLHSGVEPIRPLYTPGMPGYEHLTAINKYLSRLSYLNQLGQVECRNALYWPCEDMSRGGSADEFHQLGISLEKQGVYFDLIDDAFVRQAQIKDGCLCMGIASYQNVLVPKGATMPEDVQAKLSGFITEQAVSTVRCDNENFRFIKRNLPDGSVLYLIFNEHKDTQTGTVVFSETVPCYRLWIEDGSVESFTGHTFTLAMGETAAILFTQTPPDSVRKTCATQEEITLNGKFSLKKTAEFFSDEKGARMEPACSPTIETHLGEWKAHFGVEFSGEATYTARFQVSDDFLAGYVYEIDLGEVEYTASVKINGIDIGVAAMIPYKLRFDAGILKRDNTLELTVANTAGNRIVTADVYSYLNHKQIGSLHETMAAFEKETLGGGLLGPVVIRKMN